MSRLALGTVQFGLSYGIANQTGQVSSEVGQRMLAMAASAGIDTLDTAIIYGDSEARLGEAGVADFQVVTKLPPLPNWTADPAAWVSSQLQASLARLNLPSVHGLLLHRPADLVGPQGSELLKALLGVQDAGLAAKVGVSIYTPQELPKLMELHSFDLVQAPLNLLDRRLVKSGWLDRLASAGVEVHTRSSFLQGLLLMPLSEQQQRFPRWADLWKRWHIWLQTAPSSAVTQCLAWPLSQPGISKVVVGADSIEQLQSIIDLNVNSSHYLDLPPLFCDDEDLINPSLWSRE